MGVGRNSRAVILHTPSLPPRIPNLIPECIGHLVQSRVLILGIGNGIKSDLAPPGITGRVIANLCDPSRGIILHQDSRALRPRVLLQKLHITLPDGLPRRRFELPQSSSETGFAAAGLAERVAPPVYAVVGRPGSLLNDGADGEDGSEGFAALGFGAEVEGDGYDDGGVQVVGGVVHEDAHAVGEGKGVDGGDEGFDLVGREDQGAQPGAVFFLRDRVRAHGGRGDDAEVGARAAHRPPQIGVGGGDGDGVAGGGHDVHAQ